MRQTTLAILLTLVVLAGAGCSSTGGNRRAGAPIVTRVSELRGMVGKRVTLVGTARWVEPGGPASVQLRDGSIELPVYEWPRGHVDKSIGIMGIVAKPVNPSSPYRLGDIELAEKWSR